MRIAHIALLALLACGCKARVNVGHFGDNAFYAARDHYRVRYLDGEEQRGGVLPDAWQISNFSGGSYTERPTEPDPLVPSEMERVDFPAVRGRTVAERAPRYELRFVHPDGSVLFARSVPIQAFRTPHQALDEYVARASRGMAPNVPILGAASPQTFFAWRTMREGPARVDGRDAYFETLEATTSRGGRVRSLVTLLAVPVARMWRNRRPWQTLLVVGLATHPLAHDAHREELESFARRLDLR